MKFRPYYPAAQMVRWRAEAGETVALASSGDPGVYGMAGRRRPPPTPPSTTRQLSSAPFRISFLTWSKRSHVLPE